MAGPLTTATELDHILDIDDIRIVDCRWYLGEPEHGASEYLRGHIPGAIYASLDDDLSGAEGPGRHPLPSPETFAGTLARFGVTPATRVVAYDDCGGAIASRLWWMLTDQGHEMTSVLDGGLQAWTETGRALSASESVSPSGSFPTRPWQGVINRSAIIADHGALLIDARSRERYLGDDEPVDPKAGHIPGAISIPQADNLTTGLLFRSHSELRARFAHAGVNGATQVMVHCGSGVTACHNILAMEIAGIERPLLYVGSWSDWSSQDLPVATGDTP